MCRVLGVSPSGYHAWVRRGRSRHARRDEELRGEVRGIHARSRGTYGAPRVHAELAAQGHAVGRKRVARLMREQGLAGVSRRRGTRTTRPEPGRRAAPDLVERRFQAQAPNRLWVADITYVPTWAGFVFLAVVLDVFSRRIVGWSMADHLRTELVLEALNMAVGQRRPEAVIHHSDPRHAVHLARVRQTLPGDGGASFDRLGRGLLRQRDGRELLRHARMRAHRPAFVSHSGAGEKGGVRFRRRVVQPRASS